MFLAVENAALRREHSFLSFVEMRTCKTCREIFKPDDCCCEKSRGFSFFQPQSEDLCWDLDVFHPTCFSANATLESLSIDFTQAALVGPSGTQIIENAYAHKKIRGAGFN